MWLEQHGPFQPILTLSLGFHKTPYPSKIIPWECVTFARSFPMMYFKVDSQAPGSSLSLPTLAAWHHKFNCSSGRKPAPLMLSSLFPRRIPLGYKLDILYPLSTWKTIALYPIRYKAFIPSQVISRIPHQQYPCGIWCDVHQGPNDA